MHSREAQNSSKTEMMGWQKVAQPSGEKHLGITDVNASANAGASSSVTCFMRTTSATQSFSKPSARQRSKSLASWPTGACSTMWPRGICGAKETRLGASSASFGIGAGLLSLEGAAHSAHSAAGGDLVSRGGEATGGACCKTWWVDGAAAVLLRDGRASPRGVTATAADAWISEGQDARELFLAMLAVSVRGAGGGATDGNFEAALLTACRADAVKVLQIRANASAAKC
mmetsp:Transcript_31241/g.66476  ORF Transcript_31241/g.66476 Transcript_31241/m.66476 type:complete len:229 (+) Transcript_31241:764-1450(+)